MQAPTRASPSCAARRATYLHEDSSRDLSSLGRRSNPSPRPAHVLNPRQGSSRQTPGVALGSSVRGVDVVARASAERADLDPHGRLAEWRRRKELGREHRDVGRQFGRAARRGRVRARDLPRFFASGRYAL